METRDAGAHVLVIEDDPRFRTMVARILETAGFRVTTAEDFTTAIEAIEGDGHFDLLLADIHLPSGTPNGVTIGRMTRLRRRRLPVIYMTGAYDQSRLSAFVPEATVLMKPFSRAELICAIDSALTSV